MSSDQAFLLPPRVDEWVPPGHLARVVDEAIDLLDLSAAEAAFHTTGAGAPAYPPKLLLKRLTYGYLTQRFGSRRISSACREDLALMWRARLQQPQHSVLAAFRTQHAEDLPGWMAQVVLVCLDLGLVGLKLGALDGSKFQADASKHQAMSYQRMQEALPALEAEIATLVVRQGAADAEEASPPAVPADRLARLQARLDRIRQAKADLEDRRAAEHPEDPTPPDGTPINFTDPDAHIMVTKTRGVQQAYKGQGVVDATAGVIVGATLSAHPNDQQEPAPALTAVETATGGGPFDQLTADAGYCSAGNVAGAEAHHVDAYIAAGADAWRQVKGQTLYGTGQFTYDAPTNTYRCPAKQRLPWHHTRTEAVGGEATRTVEVYRGDRATCGACPLKAQCLTPKQRQKRLTRGADDAARDAMKAKVRTPAGDTIYRTRKGQVESAFGIIKETLGFRQFSVRGQTQCAGEWALVCLTYNVRKIAAALRRRARDTGAICSLRDLRAG